MPLYHLHLHVVRTTGLPPITYYQFTPEVTFKGDDFFLVGGVVKGSICDLGNINLLLFNGRIACIYYHRFPECEDFKICFRIKTQTVPGIVVFLFSRLKARGILGDRGCRHWKLLSTLVWGIQFDYVERITFVSLFHTTGLPNSLSLSPCIHSS
jgi:hypothetical protein